jgi:parvulin-like peptidyl-prolyl isomerase
MQWHRLLRSAAAVVGAALVGCESAPLLCAADPGSPPTAQVQPAGAPPVNADPVTRASASSPANAGPAGRVVGTVRALVCGVPILDSEIMEAAAPQLAVMRPVSDDDYKDQVKKIKAAVMEQLIERELLVQEAKHKLALANKKDVIKKVEQEADEQLDLRLKKQRSRFKSDEEYNAYMQAQGANLEELKRINRRVTLAQQYLHSNINTHIERAACHENVYEYYKTHPEEFQRTDSVQWQDIFIDASRYPSRQAALRTAEELATQARGGNGDAFVKLCEKYDNGLARTKKGAGIGTKREDISPPEAGAVLFQLHDGDVGPLVTVPAGFHVIRLVKRTHAGQAPFNEEVQKTIKEKLKNEAFVVESKRFLDEMRTRYENQIQRFTGP